MNALQLDQFLIDEPEVFTEPFIDLKRYYVSKLPIKPYCSDYLGQMFIRARDKAIFKAYVQPNHPDYHQFIVIDIDYKGAVWAWYDANFHAPNFSVMNPNNGHAHLFYFMKHPVCTTAYSNIKMIRYYAAIESAITEKLKGDIGYAGVLAKNPLSPQWKTHSWTDHLYLLDELADSLDLRGHPRRNLDELSGLGRNCEMFTQTRKWAYKTIREYWSPNYHDAWMNAVLAHCEAINRYFPEPLPYSEVKSIAKSIGKWTYQRFTPQEYSRIQAYRGSLGGKAGSKEDKAKAGAIGGKIGGKRGTAEQKAKAGSMSKGGGRKKGSVKVDSTAQQKPWESMGISRRTYYNRKKAGTL